MGQNACRYLVLPLWCCKDKDKEQQPASGRGEHHQ
jgi:hypothetical protein